MIVETYLAPDSSATEETPRPAIRLQSLRSEYPIND